MRGRNIVTNLFVSFMGRHVDDDRAEFGRAVFTAQQIPLIDHFLVIRDIEARLEEVGVLKDIVVLY